jgi:hypothetical protein
MTLRIGVIDDAYRPGVVEDAMKIHRNLDVVLGPEWARPLVGAGVVFVPRGSEKFLEWIKEAHVRETLGSGLVDEVKI